MADFLAKQRVSRLRSARPALPIDGLLCEDDMFTRGALAALHQASISLNDGLLIASHANKGSSALKSYEEHLILLEINPEEVVDAMFTLLEPMMKNKAALPQKIYIKARLIARRS